MMVLERCQEVSLRIQKHGDRRRAYKQAEAFRNRAAELKEVREALDQELSRATVLRARRIALGKAPNPSASLAAIAIYEAKVKDPDADAGREFGLLRRAVGKIRKDLAAAVQKVVEQILGDLPTIDETFLRAVEVIPDYREKVADIRRARNDLHSSSKMAASSVDYLERFLAQRDALRQLINDLDPPGFPREVLEFFRATRQPGGATLDTLDKQAVRQWLEEKDLLGCVRVTMVSR